MALFRPTYTDKKTREVKTSNFWWYKFVFAGQEIRESAKTPRKTVAAEAEKKRRKELELRLAGLPTEKRENRIKSISSILATYQKRYALDHRGRQQSILFSEGRLAHVRRILGKKLLPDLTEDIIRDYIAQRIAEGASGRTVNMEVGELSRAIGQKWSTIWPRLRKQEERKDIGQALSPEQESDLVEAAASKKRWQIAAVIIRVALLTGMRSGEITGLTWGQVDLDAKVITVGRAKTAAGTGRQIPMNGDLFEVLSMHAEWYTQKFGKVLPTHYLFPFGKPQPTDPERPTTTLKTVWGSIRKAAGVECRLHDLRHTALTKMAENGVPESTMLAIAGHMSRAMLERYSHIRMAAKRSAVEHLGRKRVPTSGVVQESVQVTEKPKLN